MTTTLLDFYIRCHSHELPGISNCSSVDGERWTYETEWITIGRYDKNDLNWVLEYIDHCRSCETDGVYKIDRNDTLDPKVEDLLVVQGCNDQLNINLINGLSTYDIYVRYFNNDWDYDIKRFSLVTIDSNTFVQEKRYMGDSKWLTSNTINLFLFANHEHRIKEAVLSECKDLPVITPVLNIVMDYVVIPEVS